MAPELSLFFSVRTARSGKTTAIGCCSMRPGLATSTDLRRYGRRSGIFSGLVDSMAARR